MATFQKIVVDPEQYGSRNFAEATKVVDVPVVGPSKGEILVRVSHTGIEASDIVQMVGGYGALAGKTPATSWDGTVQVGDSGCEGVGIITAVGTGVDSKHFAVGDAVAFIAPSFRDLVLIFVGDGTPPSGVTPPVFKVPSPAPEWTAVPISALTATGGLETAGSIQRGQNILVTGAAGGTGHIAVQWAKHMFGCRVAGTCGNAQKSELLKELGCDVVVNYREDDVEAVLSQAFPDGFDVIYEGVGGRIGNIARRLLADNGFLVQIGYVSGDPRSGTDYSGSPAGDVDIGTPAKLKEGQSEGFFFVGDWKNFGKTAAHWDQLVSDTIAAIADGKIRIQMDKGCEGFLGMDGVYAAQARMREGKNSGKIYATIDPTIAVTAAKL